MLHLHPLDHVIGASLDTTHRSFAVGNALARRYPADVAPFATIADSSPESLDALRDLLGPDDHAVLFTLADLPPIAGLEVVMNDDLDQMVGPAVSDAPDNPQIIQLGPADVDEMTALVKLTRPGPFAQRTIEMGDFFGIRVDGRLAAITGERLHPDGYRELTAVCAHPDFRRRGFPRDLIVHTSRRISARGEVPFLHVIRANTSAVSLYTKLGFVLRRTLRITVLHKRN